jgi:molybdopterin synthase sulfur carrier subunit
MTTQTMPTLKLYANLRKIAGTKELSTTGASLGQALSELILRYPTLDGAILEYGHIRPHFVITINGINATDLDAAVAEEDIIAIFPPIAGG